MVGFMEVIRTTAAPAPLAGAPYSQAIQHDGLTFVSGQIPLTPDGSLVDGGIREQTDQVLRNVAAVLDAAQSGLDHVLKTTVYMIDLSEFEAMNEVYALHFAGHAPARATVQVAALPAGARVEIDAIATRSTG